jgi:hypothetical protein
LLRNTKSAPKHMPKNDGSQNVKEWKQETLWNQ